MSLYVDEKFMRVAIQEALKAPEFGDHPIGAVLVHDGKVVAQSHNRVHQDDDVTAHAEVVVIREAVKQLGRDLNGCTLYSTHEPCPMCSSTAIFARVEGIVFGTTMQDVETFGVSRWRTITIPTSEVVARGDHNSLLVVQGCLRHECIKLFDKIPREP